ncbi:MAG: type VI secretion system baseplate subunit TssK [Pseudomonadota bacterium]|nr:type VI secretion system baseplate subunit TssK [Pseudomonadales bacterium]MDY6920097.1 type VI secretion system baseplate subunit TssK [Pseudomonadota bacterium]
MASYDKVVWSEGMLLRPQHLQQHDRYLDWQLRHRSAGLAPLGWGITELQLDTALLQQGAFAVNQAQGIFPDGTLFHVDSAEHRLLRELHPGLQGSLICLGVPVVLQGADETAGDSVASSLTRWVSAGAEVRDSNQGSSKVVTVQLARPRYRLLLESELTADYTSIPLARVRECHGDGRIELDSEYIPPCLTTSASPRLLALLQETLGLLRHRAESIAARLNAASGQRGSTDIADFMLLQLVNRFQAVLDHLEQLGTCHPESLYRQLVQLLGELATFTSESKLAPKVVTYDHRHPTAAFQWVLGGLRQALSLVFEQTAVALPLQERRFGVRVAPIQDRSLLDEAQFYLAVKCDWPADSVRSRLPGTVKVGGVEQLRELVNLQLPGINLIPQPVAPRQIPLTAGSSYFLLEKTPAHWAQLRQSGGIALHFSGEVPGLELELWAVKNQ